MTEFEQNNSKRSKLMIPTSLGVIAVRMDVAAHRSFSIRGTGLGDGLVLFLLHTVEGGISSTEDVTKEPQEEVVAVAVLDFTVASSFVRKK